MRAPSVVEGDPVTDHTQGVHLALEAMPMHTLLLQCSDHTLHHSVLLWAMRRNEFLLQAVAAYQAGVVATGEDQAVVRAQQERFGHAAQRAIAADQGLLQGGRGSTRPAGARQMPAQQLSGMAVDHQRQAEPAVFPTPDTAQVRCPALIGKFGAGNLGLDPGTLAQGPLADLPALELEDPLYRVLV